MRAISRSGSQSRYSATPASLTSDSRNRCRPKRRNTAGVVSSSKLSTWATTPWTVHPAQSDGLRQSPAGNSRRNRANDSRSR